MSTSHKFTVKTSTINEVYNKNHSRNLCEIRNACYPFNETLDGNTELFAVTPSKLAEFLVADLIPFTYESYDIEEANEQMLQVSYDALRAENKDLSHKYQTLGDKFEELGASYVELKEKYRTRGTKIQNLSDHVADLEYKLAQIRALT